MSSLIDPTQHPMYIHCLEGGNVTGQAIMVLRKLMGWNTDSIVDEYTRHVQCCPTAPTPLPTPQTAPSPAHFVRHSPPARDPWPKLPMFGVNLSRLMRVILAQGPC